MPIEKWQSRELRSSYPEFQLYNHGDAPSNSPFQGLQKKVAVSRKYKKKANQSRANARVMKKEESAAVKKARNWEAKKRNGSAFKLLAKKERAKMKTLTQAKKACDKLAARKWDGKANYARKQDLAFSASLLTSTTDENCLQ